MADNAPQYQCPDCPETRSTKTGLWRHWAIKHGDGQKHYSQFNVRRPKMENYASRNIAK